jgi:hypothetical protein
MLSTFACSWPASLNFFLLLKSLQIALLPLSKDELLKSFLDPYESSGLSILYPISCPKVSTK